MIENDYYDFNPVTKPEDYAPDVKKFIADHQKMQKARGYKLAGVRKFQGLEISVEHNKGGVRRGVDKDGHEWETKMHYAYGGIRRTRGVDGDYVDCYLGDNAESSTVYIIHQNDPVTGKYDEDKVMLGFDSPKLAESAYRRQYDRPGFFGSMESCSMDEFKAMLKQKRGVRLKKSGEAQLSLYKVQVVLPSELQKGTADDMKNEGTYVEGDVTYFSAEAVQQGIRVEMEHTNDVEVAKQIAYDHLAEDPKYYDYLEKMEAEMEARKSVSHVLHLGGKK